MPGCFELVVAFRVAVLLAGGAVWFSTRMQLAIAFELYSSRLLFLLAGEVVVQYWHAASHFSNV